MENERGVKITKKPFKKSFKAKKHFLEVDLWQKRFGEVSVKAVYDIYSQKFNIDPRNMKKYSFPHCVNTLRKLEDPNYVAPKYGSNV
jgi:hypothetical protein|tara:strand:- start:7659 stop:7919 length:261 start_codon:yes stop_codon:yes gene_type:complete